MNGWLFRGTEDGRVLASTSSPALDRATGHLYVPGGNPAPASSRTSALVWRCINAPAQNLETFPLRMRSLHSAFHALLPDIFIALERPLCGRPSHPRELPVTLPQEIGRASCRERV